jgi:hypothetical protein
MQNALGDVFDIVDFWMQIGLHFELNASVIETTT